jgi:hypothetical protein
MITQISGTIPNEYPKGHELPEHTTFKKIRPGEGGYASGDNDPVSASDVIAHENKDMLPNTPLVTPSGSRLDPAVRQQLDEGKNVFANGTVYQSGSV